MKDDCTFIKSLMNTVQNCLPNGCDKNFNKY